MKKLKILLALLIIASCFVLIGCKKETYEITLDPNGGKLDQTTITFESGNSLNLPTPTRSNKTFMGWYTSDNKKVTDESNLSSTITLFAHWDKYDVKYLNDDGSLFETLELSAGSIIDFPSSTPIKDPDKNYAYTFDKCDINENTIINKDMEVSPLWKNEQISWAKAVQGSNPLSKKMYRYAYIFKDSLFDNDPSTFSKDLALFAFGSAISTSSSAIISSFYSTLDFDDIYISPSYNVTPTTSSIAYCFAHKNIKDSDVICVTIRGSNYRKEWVNNFNFGKTGNHEGFYNSAATVYNDLMNYLDKYKDSQSLKVLTTGYSRGGGVSNVLSHQLLANDNLVNTSNLYTYTFEAPRGLLQASNLNYPNVFNIINTADVVCHVAPMQYGMVRCGIDIDIYSNKLDQYLRDNEYYSAIPHYEGKSGYESERAFPQYLLQTLISYSGQNSMSNRTNFYNNYQSDVCYLVDLFMSLKDETVNRIISDISNKSTTELLSLASNNGLFTYLNPFIKADGVSYQEDRLESACATSTKLLAGPARSLFTSGIPSTNYSRMILMHYPEVTYVLLLNYNN